MNNSTGKNIIRFVVLVLVQVLILNNIQISGYINPYFYVLFVLLLPFNTSKILLLISAFLLGLSIDLFTHTIGVHAAATTFMAYLRPGIISLLTGNKEIEPDIKPSIFDMGFTWFFTYSLILVFFHHLVLFYLEIFRLDEFLQTMLRVLASTAISLVLIIISQYLFRGSEKS
ncbi:rod shape-determining protein MreD [Bacteroidota bacterium]